jgi:hypothetical protein
MGKFGGIDMDDMKEAAQSLAVIAHLQEHEEEIAEAMEDLINRTILNSYNDTRIGDIFIFFKYLNKTVANASHDIKNQMIYWEMEYYNVYNSDCPYGPYMEYLQIIILGFHSIGEQQQQEYHSKISEIIKLGAITLDRKFLMDLFNALKEGSEQKIKEVDQQKQLQDQQKKDPLSIVDTLPDANTTNNNNVK